MRIFLLLHFVLCHNVLLLAQQPQPPPNIVFVMFDDLGWNDVSFMGSQLPTPNIDNLYTQSINLERHYIHLLCSVSRSQVLTGRYAMYSGFGKMSPFGIGHVGGIPIGLPTLPQWLKAYNADYTTYGVGKWHLGYSTEALLPSSKGFDHFFGPWSGAVMYDTAAIVANKCDGCNPNRTDFHQDDKDYNMQFSNTMYEYKHKIAQYIDDEVEKAGAAPFYLYAPIQTPHGPLDYFKNYNVECNALIGDIGENTNHRIKYCEAMLFSDDIIGEIVDKLKETDKWDNTLFILTSDNGGDIENTGCNYPLRGTKGTLFEGNQRVIALVGGGVIPKEQYGTKRESLFSGLDWLPTLLQFAGIYDQISEEDQTWDGINQYDLIMHGDDYTERMDRDHLLFSIGLRNLESATIVFKYAADDDKLYKYIAQNKEIEKAGYMRTDGWCVPNADTGDWNLVLNDAETLDPATQALDDKFLFDLYDDVSENNNILINNPDGKYDVDNLVSYALSLIKPYMEHPLFAEHIAGLWKYDVDEDRTRYGELFIHPWLSMDAYLAVINHYIDNEELHHDNPVPTALRKLYNQQWVAPQNTAQQTTEIVAEGTGKMLNVPTSCIGLKDGEHIIKLIDAAQYPLIATKCSNEYMMIDIKKDADWMQYFTSWSQWHYDIAGPDKNDAVNYNAWFIPAPYHEAIDVTDKYVDKSFYIDIEGDYPTKYLISPKCDRCDVHDAYHQQYSDKTVYNMNPAAYGLFYGVRRPACDFDWDTLECKTCKWNQDGFMSGYPRPYDLALEDTAQNDRNLPNLMIGVCLTEVRSAYQRATDGFFEFVGYGPFNYKPSLGTNGRFCQCAQIKSPEVQHVAVSQQEYDAKLTRLAVQKSEAEKLYQLKELNKESKSDNNVYYLYQSDFEIGTYRIRESGTYIVMENITIDFNAPPAHLQKEDDFSPNSPDYDWWWPPRDSAQEQYPGAGYKAREQYMLGYFAAITIETHDVILDLNGFTMAQSLAFFHQQPFFAMIELMSQPFLPNQGPGFFGADPQFAANVIIRNGEIGRSSHHGIHGTKNTNIRIENIKISNFMTHGIQMNGYDGLYLENVEIGPTTNEAFLNHNYAHLRVLLPYLNKMANFDDEHREKTIAFDATLRADNGRAYTLNELIEIATNKLDKVYKYVMSADFDADHLQELMATDDDFKLFVNANGLPYGAVVYGVYLNYAGSGIFGWDVSDGRSTDLHIKNLDIHDLYHHGREVIGLSKNKKRFVVNTLLAPLNLEHLFGSKAVIKEWIYHCYNREDGVVVEPHYKGNIATDIYLAMFKFGSDRFDEWWLGAPYIGLVEQVNIINWAEGRDIGLIMSSVTKGGDYWEPVCAMDGMVHPGKGLIGLKITNVDDLVIEGHVNVYNLFDSTPLGEEGICISPSNQVSIPKVIGSEQTPFQMAYSMNQIYGISAESSYIAAKSNVNVNVYNIRSLTGRVYGIASWFSTKWHFNTHSNIKVNDLFAGIEVKKGEFEYLSMPNHAPEVCAMGIWNGKTVNVEIKMIEDMDDYYNTNTQQFCINGHYGCWGDTESYTNVNSVSSKICEIPSNRKLQNSLYANHNDENEETNKNHNNYVENNLNYLNKVNLTNSTLHLVIIFCIVIGVVFIVVINIQCLVRKHDQFKYTSLK